MLNVKATPCEKSKAIVLVGEGTLASATNLRTI